MHFCIERADDYRKLSRNVGRHGIDVTITLLPYNYTERVARPEMARSQGLLQLVVFRILLYSLHST